MNKLKLSKLISKNDDSISYVENPGTSDVWPFFLKVNVDNVFSEHVLCSKCKALLKWKSRDSTSGLKAHTKSCVGKTESPKITKFAASTSETVKKVSTTEKTELVNVISNMCATDIRPFSIVEGVGFRRFAEKLISIGAKHGNVSVDDILPSARTVSRHVYTEAEKKRAELRKVFEKQKRFAVTTDLWTHVQTTMPYITITVLYINDQWKLCSYIIATRSMEEKHTGEIIIIFIDLNT